MKNDLGSRVRLFANHFHEWWGHECKLLTNRFTVTNVWFYFLHAILCPEHTIPLKTIIDRWFRHCCYTDGLFWLSIMTSPQVDLWRHANMGYWHSNVILVDCWCTRILVQRRPLPVACKKLQSCTKPSIKCTCLSVVLAVQFNIRVRLIGWRNGLFNLKGLVWTQFHIIPQTI